MINRLIVLLFATFLMAEDSNLSVENNSSFPDNTIKIVEIISDPNPNVYEALGDDVYNNVAYIEKLQEMPRFLKDIVKIQEYVDDVNEAKEIGYDIENRTNSISTDEYLKLMRVLSKRNNEFIQDVESSYKSSMQVKDNDFFHKIINSGLIDTQKYKSEIMSYYLENSSQIDASGVIQSYLDEEELLKKQAKAKKKVIVTKQQVQDAKIKRLRQNDKNQDARIQKQLEDELTIKKKEILEEQRDSLAN